MKARGVLLLTVKLRLARLCRAGSWLAAGGYLGLAACSGAHEPVQSPTASLPHSHITPTANVPALVGASIDGLRRRLGPTHPLPPGFDDPIMAGINKLVAPDSSVAFRTGGLLLVVNFNPHDRQVRDLLLLGQHEDSLLARASLRTSATNYLILPVFRAGSANRLLGLRVIPTK
jgi:hypothetical protein